MPPKGWSDHVTQWFPVIAAVVAVIMATTRADSAVSETRNRQTQIEATVQQIPERLARIETRAEEREKAAAARDADTRAALARIEARLDRES